MSATAPTILQALRDHIAALPHPQWELEFVIGDGEDIIDEPDYAELQVIGYQPPRTFDGPGFFLQIQIGSNGQGRVFLDFNRECRDLDFNDPGSIDWLDARILEEFQQ